MSRLQQVLAIFVGAGLAASLYLLIAANTGSGIVSFHAAIYVLILGWLAIPVIAIALNITNRSKWTVTLGVVSAPILGFYFFIGVLKLPGAEWMSSNLFTRLAFLYVLAGLILAVRLPPTIPILLASSLLCFFAGVVLVHFVTRWALQNQIERTIADGGCIITGMREARRAEIADDVAFGWIVGPRSEPVYLVYEDYYLRWSYSRFGLDTRMGLPKKYQLTDIGNTQRYSRTDKLSCD